MPAGGYFGQALVVDVTSGTSRNQPLPDSVLRGYIGGSGLGTWLLCQLGTAGADPLGPRAPLAFVFSPLVGTPLTTSAKFAVVAKSPLTGMLTDALASSQFAIAGKLTGHDAIVIDGRAPELSVLLPAPTITPATLSCSDVFRSAPLRTCFLRVLLLTCPLEN